MKLDYYFQVAVLVLLTLIAIELWPFNRPKEEVKEEEQMEVVKDSTIDLCSLELTPDNFMTVCAIYGISHPEIVYAQARLESGHFTSKVYRTKNNFLGLYDSRKKDYYAFNHWTDCLKGYRDYVQCKWDGNTDYYVFLTNLPYAADPNYIKKIKILTKI